MNDYEERVKRHMDDSKMRGMQQAPVLTKEQLLLYLRVCADLANAPDDGVAYVRVDCLRQAIDLLQSPAEPPCEHMYVCKAGTPIGEAYCVKCGASENRGAEPS